MNKLDAVSSRATPYQVAFDSDYKQDDLEEKTAAVAISVIEAQRAPSPIQSVVEGAAPDRQFLEGTLSDADRELLEEYGWTNEDFEELEDLDQDEFFDKLMDQAIEGEGFDVVEILPADAVETWKENIEAEKEEYKEFEHYFDQVMGAGSYDDIQASSEDEMPEDWRNEKNPEIYKTRVDTFNFNRWCKNDNERMIRDEISKEDLSDFLSKTLEREGWSEEDLIELENSESFIPTLASQAIENKSLYILKRIDIFELIGFIGNWPYDEQPPNAQIVSKIEVFDKFLEKLEEWE